MQRLLVPRQMVQFMIFKIFSLPFGLEVTGFRALPRSLFSSSG